MIEQRHQVLVADTYPIFVSGMVAVLGTNEHLEVKGLVLAAPGLPAAMEGSDAAVLVVGLSGNSVGWLRSCAQLHSRYPRLRMILLADPGSDLDLAEVARSGVHGLLLRSSSEADLVVAVDNALAGQGLVAAELTGPMLAAFAANLARGDANSAAGGLSARELEVLRLVATGLPNRDVALRLHISENTVKNHMRSVHEKLGACSRTEAVAIAAREGILGNLGMWTDYQDFAPPTTSR